MEFIIIRGVKAKVPVVFDYLETEELRNPLPHQKDMLDEICEDVEFVKKDRVKEAIQLLGKGDRLYQEDRGRLKLKSIGI